MKRLATTSELMQYLSVSRTKAREVGYACGAAVLLGARTLRWDMQKIEKELCENGKMPEGLSGRG